jgi:hypothetical protein
MDLTDPAAIASPRSHWKRRTRANPMAPGHAARQGAITQLAFLVLGRERAIDFLNLEHPGLGGRPLALATESAEGRASVEAEIGRMAYREPEADDSRPAPVRLADPE